MNLEWKKIRGSIKPLETDTTSSSYFVYLRRNIQEVERQSNETIEENLPEGEKQSSIEYEYEEAKINREDYLKDIALLNSLDTEQIMQNLSEQELDFQEELLERDERLESIAQSLSELELTVMENTI